MKQFAFSFLLLFAIQKCFAQVVIVENPSYTNSVQKPLLNKLLDIEVLKDTSKKLEFKPTTEKICFDKRIKLKTDIARGSTEICLYINTKIGLIAYSTLKPGGTRYCDIQPSLPNFALNIIGLKGNVYQYQNIQGKRGIEHWVIVNNTDRFLNQFTNADGGSCTLIKIDESREYLSGKIKAWAYKCDNNPEKWFLFGKLLPDKLIMERFKYIGNFGVGFQYTDKGQFLIMQMESTGYTAEILEIEDVETCFDPTAFRVFEDDNYTKSMQAINQQEQRLKKKLLNVKPDECSGLEIRNIKFEQELLERRKRNLELARQGNLLHQYSPQRALGEATINYEDNIQIVIYDTERKICQANKRLAEATTSEGVESYKKKLTCLNSQMANQLEIQRKIRLIDTQYPNQAGRQFAEKSRIFMQVVQDCN